MPVSMEPSRHTERLGKDPFMTLFRNTWLTCCIMALVSCFQVLANENTPLSPNQATPEKIPRLPVTTVMQSSAKIGAALWRGTYVADLDNNGINEIIYKTTVSSILALTRKAGELGIQWELNIGAEFRLTDIVGRYEPRLSTHYLYSIDADSDAIIRINLNAPQVAGPIPGIKADAIDFFDFNNDNIDELVTYHNENISVYELSTWKLLKSYQAPKNIKHLRVGHFLQKNQISLLLDKTELYRIQGDQLEKAESIDLGSPGQAIKADIEQNGIDEIVFSYSNGWKVYSPAKKQVMLDYFVASLEWGIAVGDLDHDGILDIATPDDYGNSNSLVILNGITGKELKRIKDRPDKYSWTDFGISSAAFYNVTKNETIMLYTAKGDMGAPYFEPLHDYLELPYSPFLLEDTDNGAVYFAGIESNSNSGAPLTRSETQSLVYTTNIATRETHKLGESGFPVMGVFKKDSHILNYWALDADNKERIYGYNKNRGQALYEINLLDKSVSERARYKWNFTAMTYTDYDNDSQKELIALRDSSPHLQIAALNDEGVSSVNEVTLPKSNYEFRKLIPANIVNSSNVELFSIDDQSLVSINIDKAKVEDTGIDAVKDIWRIKYQGNDALLIWKEDKSLWLRHKASAEQLLTERCPANSNTLISDIQIHKESQFVFLCNTGYGLFDILTKEVVWFNPLPFHASGITTLRDSDPLIFALHREFSPLVLKAAGEPAMLVPHEAESAGAVSKASNPVTLQLKPSMPRQDHTFEITASPKHGRLSHLDRRTGKLSYTADPDFAGTDSFQYVVKTPDSDSAPATITIEITNNEPVLNGNTQFSTHWRTPLTGQLSFADPDGDLLRYQVVQQPDNGQITFADSGKGQFTYTPSQADLSVVTADILASDLRGANTQATLNITLTNKAPQAANVTAATQSNSPVVVQLKGEDPDQDPLRYEILSPPDKGSATLEPDTGKLTYTPAGNMGYSVTLRYRTTDRIAASEAAEAVIKVTAAKVEPPQKSGGGSVPPGFLLCLCVICLIRCYRVIAARQ